MALSRVDCYDLLMTSHYTGVCYLFLFFLLICARERRNIRKAHILACSVFFCFVIFRASRLEMGFRVLELFMYVMCFIVYLHFIFLGDGKGKLCCDKRLTYELWAFEMKGI